ncbi:MAG TPA: head maturation protease, ClpP-related [Rhizomicrobium sp.]
MTVQSEHRSESDEGYRRDVEATSQIPSSIGATSSRQANPVEADRLNRFCLHRKVLMTSVSPISLICSPKMRARPGAISVGERPKGLKVRVDRVADPVFDVSLSDQGATISIFSEIGGDTGVTVAGMSDALKQAGSRDVTVQINSPGGDYFEGVGIYNLLRAHTGKVTAQILGIAASAASIIAMAADRVEMARNGELMIHRAWTLAVGNSELMREAATMLDRVDAAAVGVYAERSGQKANRVRELMVAETWMTSEEAIAGGFADALLAADALPAPKLAATPRSRREFEKALAQLGYAKAAAKRLAAEGWCALDHQAETDPDIPALTTRVKAANLELRKVGK